MDIEIEELPTNEHLRVVIKHFEQDQQVIKLVRHLESFKNENKEYEVKLGKETHFIKEVDIILLYVEKRKVQLRTARCTEPYTTSLKLYQFIDQLPLYFTQVG